jgi:hypothetical protein
LFFPLEHFPDLKNPVVPGVAVMNDPETAPAYIGQLVSVFKDFPCTQGTEYAVKMNRDAGSLIAKRRRQVLYGFTADRADWLGKGFLAELGGRPFGPVHNDPPVLIKMGLDSAFFLP